MKRKLLCLPLMMLAVFIVIQPPGGPKSIDSIRESFGHSTIGAFFFGD